MIAKRIIACLDVRDGVVVKGVQFRNHKIVGDVIDLAQRYADEGVDELVFYDITASSDSRTVSKEWVRSVARVIDIPFCVAGGIKTVEDARVILNDGADKVSINSPALNCPDLINEMADMFGVQCVVVGIDSRRQDDGTYKVYKYTGDENKMVSEKISTFDWVKEVQERGAGEIVLNCMSFDGVRKGYDLKQLSIVRKICHVPLIASGGAGEMSHFRDVFESINVDGALAASVFHSGDILIPDLKLYLSEQKIKVRLCAIKK